MSLLQEKIYKDFGRISKYAMSDKGLTTEAKAIYAYLCSFAETKSAISYPKVTTIIKDLQITEKRFYKHMKLLVEQGYIEISKVRCKSKTHLHNAYTIATNPKNLQEVTQEIYSTVTLYETQNADYNTLTKAVMRDNKLSVTAKAIYAYFFSHIETTNDMFLTRDTILYHLDITEPTYYKHYNQLLELGYITKDTAYNAKKKHNMTMYFINDPRVHENNCPRKAKYK